MASLAPQKYALYGRKEDNKHAGNVLMTASALGVIEGPDNPEVPITPRHLYASSSHGLGWAGLGSHVKAHLTLCFP